MYSAYSAVPSRSSLKEHASGSGKRSRTPLSAGEGTGGTVLARGAGSPPARRSLLGVHRRVHFRRASVASSRASRQAVLIDGHVRSAQTMHEHQKVLIIDILIRIELGVPAIRLILMDTSS